MKIISSMLVACALLTSSTSAYEGDWYGGAQLSGLSLKYDLTNDTTAQGIVNFWGYGYNVDVLSFTGRYIKKVKQARNYNFYWAAGAGITTISGSNTNLGTAFHGEAGIGAEYDIRGIDKDFVPIFISGELDAGFVSVSGYGGAGIGLDVGLHYKF